MVQADGVERAAQPQHDIAPALTAGRPVRKFADALSEFGLFRKILLDAVAGQAIQRPEFLLPQSFVSRRGDFRVHAPGVADLQRGLAARRYGETSSVSGR